MIIDRSYFKGEIYIPNVEDIAPDSELLGNGSELDVFITEYEREVLIKCLGFSLYSVFKSQFNSDNSPNLKNDSEQKWKDLLNGKSYNIDGKMVNWSGLIHKNNPFKRSLIAYYVYFHFLNNDISHYTGTGMQVEKTKSAENVSHIPKAVRAWRKFYELTVGTYNTTSYIEKANGTGIDWGNCESAERSLYQFIQDMNNSDVNTYPNWQPYFFENLNILGI